MKLIVAGGRDFNNPDIMLTSLSTLVNEGKIPNSPELVCGMARGADLLAHGLWKQEGMIIHEMPADWDKHGKSAGYIRNAEMAAIADAAVCFWDGKSRGTMHMIQIMQKLRKPVYVIGY